MYDLPISDTVKFVDITPPLTLMEYVSQPSSLIAITAIIISVIAVFLSVRQYSKILDLTKTHNILSVRPLITSSCSFGDDNKYLLELRNAGVGPCIILSLVYIYKGHKEESFCDLAERLLLEKGYSKEAMFYDFAVNHCISSGQSVELFSTSIPRDELKDLKYDQLDMLNSIFSQIEFEIEYEDIYHTRYSLTDLLIMEDLLD